jgi:hypothetical protein
MHLPVLRKTGLCMYNSPFNFKYHYMKKHISIYTLSVSLVVITALTITISLVGCAPTKAVANKTGVQLWSENCQRCHNTPSPATFSPEIWETVGMHMQTRALITEKERDKIVEFLKSAR